MLTQYVIYSSIIAFSAVNGGTGAMKMLTKYANKQVSTVEYIYRGMVPHDYKYPTLLVPLKCAILKYKYQYSCSRVYGTHPFRRRAYPRQSMIDDLVVYCEKEFPGIF